jgi:hypothetical protein
MKQARDEASKEGATHEQNLEARYAVHRFRAVHRGVIRC